MKISAVIITKNEEKNIQRLLSSVVNLVDEIVIVDSGSIDQTRQIAQQFSSQCALKWLDVAWQGYGATKNLGHSAAQFDWILSLDADEEISPELAIEIQSLKTQHNISSQKAYRVNRITNYAGHWIKHSGWNPDWHVRLFNRTNASWNLAQVHESLEFIQPPVINDFRGRLNHYSYPSVNDHISKLTHYAKLGAQGVAHKSRISLLVKMVFNPPFRLFRVVVFNGAWLDGKYGLIVAWLTAYGVFLKYRFALQLKK